EIAAAISLDEINNAIYISGDFKNTCSFGTSSLTSDGLYDAFLAKYTLTGTLSYAKRVAWGTTTQRSVSLCTDNSGNVVVTGIFLTSAQIDGGITLTGNATTSNYIIKYNSSGTMLWNKKVLGKYSLSWLRDIKPYSGGYIIAGQFRDTLFLDLGNIISEAANVDMFLYAIDNSGNGQWVRTIKGAAGDDHFNKLSVSDNIYIAAISKSTSLNAQTGASTFQTLSIGNSGNFDLLLFTYSTSGDYKWHKKYGSVADDRSLNVNSNGSSVSIAGYYSGSMSIETYDLPYSSGSDGFSASYNSSGNINSVFSMQGSSSDYVRAVQPLTGSNMMISGDFTSDTLHMGSEYLLNSNAGASAAFIAKYGCSTELALSSTPVSCLDGFGMPVVDNGTASVVASSGRPPYAYIWNNGQTNANISGLGLGTFNVTVTDANGCTSIGSVVVSSIPVVSASIQSYNNATCSGNDGSITAVATNGTTPYTYLWNSTPNQTTATASNLSAGTYRVTITDGCGNYSTATQTITQAASTVSVVITKTNVTCNGAHNGTATATPTGGTSPYTYLWSNGQTTQTATGLYPITYYVTVTESLGCSATQSTIIATVPAVSATIPTTTPVTCRGGSDGTATAQPVNGTGPYTYKWSNTQITQTATGLSATTYRVTITDVCGNTSVATTTITQPNALAVTITGQSPTCTGGTNGTATANPTEGTAPYAYRWSTTPTQTTQTAINLSAGISYRVTVTDNCGTSRTQTITLANPTALSVSTTTYQNPTCFGVSNGWITATTSNGSSPYTYIWSNGQTSQTAINLASGNYSVTVIDGCNTTKTSSRTLSNSSLTATLSPTCTPSGLCQGTITATPTNGNSPYTYIWSNNQTTQTATNLCENRYYVTITDANGCKYNSNARIKKCNPNAAPADIFASKSSNSTTDFYITPNPGSAIVRLYVSEYDGMADVRIYNSTGSLFYSQNKVNLSESDIEFSVSNWTKGIYMVVVYTDSEAITKRLIVE
ncbi:MAG: hypothetical protein CVU05_14560, partial [Bacteroidetes bacterium HGW-Bacteroidetes-21]